MNVLILYMLLWSVALGAEESWHSSGPEGFAAEAKLLESKVFLPNPVNVALTLTFPSSYHVDERGLTGNLLRSPKPGAAPFTLVSMQHEKMPSDDKDTDKEIWNFQLEPLLAGKQALTFLNISFLPNSKENGKIVELVSGIFQIEISLPNVREVYFPPMETPLNLSGNFPIDLDSALRAKLQQKMISQTPGHNLETWQEKKFPWEAAFVLAALLLTAFFFRMIPRKKAHPKVPLQSQVLFRQAEEKLQALQQQPQLDAPAAAAFIVDLSNAIRAHIEETYALNVRPETTEEFFAQIDASNDLDPQKLELLKEFIRHADQVKFAFHSPSLEECLAARKAAKEILSL